ncbi:hypothetical protein FRX31_013869, partial [Thalictrum thalictroides]
MQHKAAVAAMQHNAAGRSYKAATSNFSLAVAIGKLLTFSLIMHNRSDIIGRL